MRRFFLLTPLILCASAFDSAAQLLPTPQPRRVILAAPEVASPSTAPSITRVVQTERGEVTVTGPADTVLAAEKLLKRADRAAKKIIIEVMLAEIKFAKADANTQDLAGPGVLARLDTLAAAGNTVTRRTITLNATEGTTVTTSDGGSKPYTTSDTLQPPGGGRAVLRQRSVSYRDLGTTIALTATPVGDKSVAIDLKLEDSRIGEADAEAVAPSFDTTRLETRVVVAPGVAAVARSATQESKVGRTASLVIVTVHVTIPTAGEK